MMSLLVWCCLTGTASAVSLGKIEVASHLGEPFFAQLEVHLTEGESMDKVHASIAARSDYRILEIYREPAVAGIRVTRKSDGSPVLELSSAKPVRVPFFNLVVKLSYGRFTQFKKFPIFLELPKAIQPPVAGKQSAVPTVRAKGPEVVPVLLQSAGQEPPKKQADQQQSRSFEPFDGWARASVYGPIVRGDMLSTVAQRLKIDDRYTLAQIVVALYEKNPDKFNAGNFNLLKKGAMLKVPTRAEIEKHSPTEASRIFQQHLDRWKELVRKPRYAAEKRAQETRYSPRIRVGEKAEAEHEAAATVAAVEEKEGNEAAETKSPAVTEDAARPEIPASSAVSETAPKPELKGRVETEEGSGKPGSSSSESDKAPATVASTAVAGQIDRQLKDMERQLQQMQLQLTRLQEEKSRDAEITQWILVGMAVLIVILLLALLMALRRRPTMERAATRVSVDSEPTVAEEAKPVAAPASVIPDSEVAPKTEASSVMPDTDATETKAVEDETNQTDTADSQRENMPLPVATDASNPNIDHLADADVYLRYGMEDEAMKMVELALQADPYRVDAHIKKILILSFFAREEELKRSIETSMQAIADDERERFLAALRDMGLDDILPAAAENDVTEEQAGLQHEESGDAAGLDQSRAMAADTTSEAMTEGSLQTSDDAAVLDEADVNEEQAGSQHEESGDTADLDQSRAMAADTTSEAMTEGSLQTSDDAIVLDEAIHDSVMQVKEAEDVNRQGDMRESPAMEGDELTFDVSDLDLGEAGVESHAPRESGLVAGDEALNFNLEGPDEDQSAAQTPADESRQEQPDTDHVRKLDRLLDQLEQGDDEPQH